MPVQQIATHKDKIMQAVRLTPLLIGIVTLLITLINLAISYYGGSSNQTVVIILLVIALLNFALTAITYIKNSKKGKHGIKYARLSLKLVKITVSAVAFALSLQLTLSQAEGILWVFNIILASLYGMHLLTQLILLAVSAIMVRMSQKRAHSKQIQPDSNNTLLHRAINLLSHKQPNSTDIVATDNDDQS